MNAKETLVHLACPGCQAALRVREGQRIVRCSYCGLPSAIVGERGVLRYQVRRKVDADQALAALRQFLRVYKRLNDLDKRAEITELTPVFIPFWTVRAQVAAWQFGYHSDPDSGAIHPREEQLMTEMVWTQAACDLDQFGVQSIPLVHRELELFDPEALRQQGMVFEPTGSLQTLRRHALEAFRQEVAHKGSPFSALFTENTVLRLLNERIGLVYYPLWIVRYQYQGRLYPVLMDGISGRVLFGMAPGNTFLGAIALVVGLAGGAFFLVALPSYTLNSFGLFPLNAMLLVFAPLAVCGLAYLALRWFRLAGPTIHRTRARAVRSMRPRGRMGARTKPFSLRETCSIGGHR